MVTKDFKGQMTPEKWAKIRRNVFKFVAPTLAIFFGQLATGINWKIAAPVALLALYQGLADYFTKKAKSSID